MDLDFTDFSILRIFLVTNFLRFCLITISILRIFQFYGFFPDDELIRKIEKLLYLLIV